MIPMSFNGLVRLVALHRELEREPWLQCTTSRALVDLIGSWAADNIADAYRPEGIP